MSERLCDKCGAEWNPGISGWFRLKLGVVCKASVFFASPTPNTLEETGADICSVTDIFAFSLRARNWVLECTLTNHAKVSAAAKLRDN